MRLFRRGGPEEALPAEEHLDDYESTDEKSQPVPEIEPYATEEQGDDGPQVAMSTQVHRLGLAGLLALGAAIAVIALGLQTQIAAETLARWPWVFIIVGGLWLAVGVVTALPQGVLGGPMVMAIGAVGLLSQQQTIDFPVMALGGAMAVALGLGVILRGITMPRAGA